MDPIISVVTCAAGFALGAGVRRGDFWAGFFGIATAFSIAYALTLGGAWFLLGVPVFGFFLMRRRSSA